MVLAHRWLRLQCFADLERLLVALECVLVAAQQQADTADVAERVTQPARKLHISVDCEGFFVLRQRSLVVAQFIEDEAEVVDCGAFQLAIANLSRKHARPSKPRFRFIVVAEVPFQEAQRIDRLAHSAAVSSQPSEASNARSRN